jgi:hypothetical protein
MTSISTGWTTRGENSSPRGGKNFHFCMMSRPALGPTQPRIQCVTVAISPGVKWPGPETDHSIHALSHTPSWRSA